MTAVWYISDTEEIMKASCSDFHMIVLLLSHCRNNHHCHQYYLEWTFLEDELKYWMTAESRKWIIIQPKAMRMVHLKAFPSLKIMLTGMMTRLIKMGVKMTGRQTTNLIQS
jgi:hypothetical protein